MSGGAIAGTAIGCVAAAALAFAAIFYYIRRRNASRKAPDHFTPDPKMRDDAAANSPFLSDRKVAVEVPVEMSGQERPYEMGSMTQRNEMFVEPSELHG